MKRLSFLILLITSLFFASCNKPDKVVVFSKEKPFSIEVKKERSFFQAKKISDRLNEMNIPAYLIYQEDSIDGNWYKIFVGAESVEDSILVDKDSYKQELQTDELSIVHFDSLSNFKIVINGDTSIVKETQRIDANKPDVPEVFFQVASQYPQSNALFLKNINFLNLNKEIKETSMLISSSMELDLPRGIGLNKLSAHCFGLSEAVFKDNLFEDRVTMHIARLRPVVNHQNTASIINATNKRHFETAEIFADLILETGEYLLEEKEEIEIQAIKKLYGYKVRIEPRQDYIRTYFVLVDEMLEYLFFSQSTDKTDDELMAILLQIGNDQGLNDYNEFYNAFYTLPDDLPPDDMFLGFTLGKLDWTYAKSRGYAKWANKMVGHWDAMGYFYNQDKGIWSFSLFDMLTQEKQAYIYGTLYSGHNVSGKYERDFYGTKGYAVYNEYRNWYTYKMKKSLAEINFGINRYIFAIGNSLESVFNEDDLTTRAQAMQFQKGGYKIASK